MTKNGRRAWLGIGGTAVLSLLYYFALQFAFLNHGQEFGAYGQYNRVLRIARMMDDYEVVGHGVRRKLEFAHIAHVEGFSLTLRDKGDRIAAISFAKDTTEMNLDDDTSLRDAIQGKFAQATAQ